MAPWIRLTLAAVVACHGLTYAMFGPLALKRLAGGATVTGPRLGGTIIALHEVAGALLMACALAIAFAAPAWWRPLAIGGAVVSAAAFVSFWRVRPGEFVEAGGIGLTLSVALLVAALVFPHAFDAR